MPRSPRHSFFVAQRELESMAIRESPRSDDDHGEQKQRTPPPNGSLLEFLRDRRSPMIEPKGDTESTHPVSGFGLDHSSAHSPSLHQSIGVPNTAVASAKTPSPEAKPTSGYGVKRSRYLRESDRRSIIRRIDRGEKQAALAKEFGVTRAAICHINKNRAEILMRSTRPDVHWGARHPKRGVHTTTAHQDTAHAVESPRQPPMVYELRSQALKMLMTSLRCKETSSRTYRAVADRAFRILIEEAIATVPTHAVNVTTPSGFVCPGAVADDPSCAMIMSECGYPLLEAFRAIQPDAPTGFMTLEHQEVSESASATSSLRLRKMSAPPNLSRHNVFLLDSTCATSHEATAAIQALVDFGAQEHVIFLVALVCSAPAVAEICERFPTVRIVTAAIDPETLENGAVICPGIGSFQERYFNTTTIRQTHLGANVFL